MSGWAGRDSRRGGGGGLGVEYAVRNKERQRANGRKERKEERLGRVEADWEWLNPFAGTLPQSARGKFSLDRRVSKAIDHGRSLCLGQLSSSARDTARTLPPRLPSRTLTPRHAVRTSICAASPPPIENKLAPGARRCPRGRIEIPITSQTLRADWWRVPRWRAARMTTAATECSGITHWGACRRS